MVSVPMVKKGFFLAQKAKKSGGWLYATFPIKDKSYYLGTGWQEISPELAAEQQKPVAPPAVNQPDRITHAVVPLVVKPRGRPKRNP